MIEQGSINHLIFLLFKIKRYIIRIEAYLYEKDIIFST